MTFDKIKGYYDKGFWNVVMVGKNIITAVQFMEITGVEYE